MTYQEVSKKVGYLGSIPFPKKKNIQDLCKKLLLEPDITTFSEALSIYRFAPEATDENQRITILLLKQALHLARKELWGSGSVVFVNKVELNFLKVK